jgi:hypothetical protein
MISSRHAADTRKLDPSLQADKTLRLSFDEMPNYIQWWMPVSQIDGKPQTNSVAFMKDLDVQSLLQFDTITVDLDVTPPAPTTPPRSDQADLEKDLQNLVLVLTQSKIEIPNKGQKTWAEAILLSYWINGKQCSFSDDNTELKPRRIKENAFSTDVQPLKQTAAGGKMEVVPNRYVIQVRSKALFQNADTRYIDAFIETRAEK